MSMIINPYQFGEATFGFIAAASVDSATISTPAAAKEGDILIVSAFRTNGTAIDLPAGWNNLVDGRITTGTRARAIRVGYMIAGSTPPADSMWTNGNRLSIGVYRGFSGVGAAALFDDTAFPALSLLGSESWVVGCGGWRNGTNNTEPAPVSGMSKRTGLVSANNGTLLHDTGAIVSSWPLTAISIARGCLLASIELIV